MDLQAAFSNIGIVYGAIVVLIYLFGYAKDAYKV